MRWLQLSLRICVNLGFGQIDLCEMSISKLTKIYVTIVFYVFGCLFSGCAFAAHVRFVVPTETIRYKEQINKHSLKYKMFAINPDAASRYVLDFSQIEGKVARGLLLKDHPILLSSLKDPVLVEQGKSIKLIVRGANLVITATGIPLQSGSAGDYIKVRNVDSGRTVSGTITKDGSVEVGTE